MSNPLNPLNWLQSAQDWFAKTERSSGFRPYLIFLILIFGMALSLLLLSNESLILIWLAVSMIGLSSLAFIVIFGIKSFCDPNFCRSEVHVERIKRIEMEKFGTESAQIDVSSDEDTILVQQAKDRPAIDVSSVGGGAEP
jgi:hypothetical protein